MSTWRAALRPHRSELVAIAILSVVVLLLAGGLAIRLLSFDLPPECLGFDGPSSATCEGLGREIAEYNDTRDRWSMPAFYGIALLPVLSGLVLGISLVAKELDQGTTTLAWSIGPSRRRWLLLRVVPVVAFVVAAGLAAGLLGDLLMQLGDPTGEARRNFALLGVRGVVVASVAFSALGVALLVGSVVGRLLPALAIAALLVLGTSVGVALLNETFLRTEALIVDADQILPGRPIDSRVRTPEGEIITFEEAFARYGDDLGEMGPTSPLRMVQVVNPAEIYPLAVARMTVLHAALGFVALVLTFAVVDRRRP